MRPRCPLDTGRGIGSRWDSLLTHPVPCSMGGGHLAETLGLIAATDAIILLHRSEGLGLLIAKAMLLERPVIATDNSASEELVTDATAYPVGYELASA
jgi:glycosyltransferase involved in cell wall biosynthesis